MMTISLEVERKTVGQASWKSEYLPGEEKSRRGRQRTITSKLGAKEDGSADMEVSEQPMAECLGACASQRVKVVLEVIERCLTKRGQGPPQNKEREWVNM